MSPKIDLHNHSQLTLYVLCLLRFLVWLKLHQSPTPDMFSLLDYNQMRSAGDVTDAGTMLHSPSHFFYHAEDALRIALEENKRLAREYEDLKKRLVEARQEAVSALGQRNQAHQSFHYYTQVFFSAVLVFIAFVHFCPGLFL